MSCHPEVLVVGQTFLCPPVNQVVRFVGAAVAPSRPGIGLSMLGQDLGRK
jgi:hypothetical protein